MKAGTDPENECAGSASCDGKGGCVGVASLARGPESDHSCAVMTDGTARCWGRGDSGQLGDGTTSQRLMPTAVVGLTNVVQMAVGWAHTCAVRTDGSVWCWGHGGQLGDGTNTNRPTPGAVLGLGQAVEVAAGEWSTCARLVDGTAWCWGDNGYGQLGDGTQTFRPLPVQMLGVTDAAGIAVGVAHSCVLSKLGTVRCFGLNDQGQLGDGTKTWRPTGAQAVGVATATRVAAGHMHSCAALADGTARCWGTNAAGTLGDGTNTMRTVPTPVVVSLGGAPLGGVVDVVGHYASTCALRADGTVACWGSNSLGQLGDGSGVASRWIPGDVRVTPGGASLTGVVALGAGRMHDVALTGSGVVAWGSNVYGSLGDGTTTSRPTPVGVGF